MTQIPLEPQPRPVYDPTELHLIGQEWVERGYQTSYIPDTPDRCPIDGAPMNTCTGHEGD